MEGMQPPSAAAWKADRASLHAMRQAGPAIYSAWEQSAHQDRATFLNHLRREVDDFVDEVFGRHMLVGHAYQRHRASRSFRHKKSQTHEAKSFVELANRVKQAFADNLRHERESREVAAQERCILLSCVSSDDEDEELEFRNLLYSWVPAELPTSIIEDSCNGMPECSSMSDLDYTLLDMTNAADLMLLVAHGA